jgi:hypothetical protein
MRTESLSSDPRPKVLLFRPASVVSQEESAFLALLDQEPYFSVTSFSTNSE